MPPPCFITCVCQAPRESNARVCVCVYTQAACKRALACAFTRTWMIDTVSPGQGALQMCLLRTNTLTDAFAYRKQVRCPPMNELQQGSMQSKQHTPGRLRCIQLLNGERREQERRKSYRQYLFCSHIFPVLFTTTHHAVSQGF